MTEHSASRTSWWLAPLEVLLSALTVCLAVLFPLLSMGAHLCAWGECGQPSSDDVRTYHVLLVVLVVSVVATGVVAVRRGAQTAFVWHGLVTAAAVASAFIFSISTAGPGEVPTPPVPDTDAPSTNYVPCHSGPPNDCPGG